MTNENMLLTAHILLTSILSQFESTSFRTMIQLASVEAERALWASHNSVSQYVIRLYNYFKPKVVAELSQSISKVYISFNG
jgi:regulator of PEP synthase PpsR (kinase-PPPase family)